MPSRHAVNPTFFAPRPSERIRISGWRGVLSQHLILKIIVLCTNTFSGQPSDRLFNGRLSSPCNVVRTAASLRADGILGPYDQSHGRVADNRIIPGIVVGRPHC
jgi:hypothetical protein